MVKISRKIEYALMALKHSKGKVPGTLTTAKEVADVYGAPFDVTAKVMQSMAQGGLLKSEQGPHGGYLLIKDLTKVSFFDLVELIDGPVGIVKCLHQDKHACDLSPTCNIVNPVSYINERLIDFYKNLTLSETIGSASSQGRAT